MAVNFCLPRFSPSISCSKVASEGYEAENLISADSECLKRGYLAATFISPPVEINLQFPHSVDINFIVLGLRNGSQHTCDVRVYSDYNNPDNERSNNFRLIGMCKDVTDSKLCLTNFCYRPTAQFSVYEVDTPILMKKDKLKTKWISNVCRVQRLKICLTRTSNSTVPALSLLQVWGQPGSDSDENLKNSIFEIESLAREQERVTREEESAAASIRPEEVSTTDISENTNIPEEFVDSITYEIMSQPILLPSGINLDQLTLEKHIKASSAWGHLPNDPFTGIPFSKENQPKYNLELKTRIDSFLIAEGSHLNVPRTTGRRLFIPKSVSRHFYSSACDFLEQYVESEKEERKKRKLSAAGFDNFFFRRGNYLFDGRSDLFDERSNSVDDENDLLDEENYLYDDESDLVDEEDILVDEEIFVDEEDIFFNEGNNVVEEGNNIVDEGNDVVDEGNNVVDEGNILVEGGRNLVDEGSNIVNEGNNLNLLHVAENQARSCASLEVAKSSTATHKEKLAESLKQGLKQVLEGRPSFIQNSNHYKCKSNWKYCIICNVTFPHPMFRLPCSHLLCRSCLVIETKACTLFCKLCIVPFKPKDVIRVHF